MPVLGELRYWQSSIGELICAAFRRQGLSLSATGLDDLLSQNWLLLFDGVNEQLPEMESQPSVL